MNTDVRADGAPSDISAAVMNLDITDPEIFVDERPEEIWRVLRDVGTPIRFGGLREHWAVTRYRHVEEVYRNGAHFSVEKGMHLGAAEKGTGSNVAKCRAELAAEAAAGKSLQVTDDPIHAEMRRAIGAAFSHRMVRRLSDSTLEVARSLVSDAVTGEPVDFIQAVAAPLPAIVICELLGVPQSDRVRVMELTQRAFSDADKESSSAQVVANAELFAYCDELVTSKRRMPGEDVATVLAQATIQGRPMTHEAAVLNCHDLIAAGNETARHASGAAAMSMATHPECWAELRIGRADAADATEEILRLEAPVSHVLRVALDDIEIGGAAISRGEYVTLWLRSANRDAEIFENPDDVRFSRRPNRHLTFGLGNHFCIGASLARIEVRSVIQALLELVGDVELCGRPRRLASNFLRGYRTLPMSLRPRGRHV